MTTVRPAQTDPFAQRTSAPAKETSPPNNSSSKNSEPLIAHGSGGMKRSYSALEQSDVKPPLPKPLTPAEKPGFNAHLIDPSQASPASQLPAIQHFLNQNSLESDEQLQQDGNLWPMPFGAMSEGLDSFYPLDQIPLPVNQPAEPSTSTRASSERGLDPLAEAQRCHSTALAFLDNDQPDEAIEVLQNGLGFEHGDKCLKATLYINLSCAFIETQQFEKGIPAIVNSLKIEHNDPVLRATSLYNLGKVYCEIGQQAYAVPALKEGLELEHSDQLLKGRLYFKLGDAFRLNREYHNAIQAFQEGLKLEDIGVVKPAILCNMGLVYHLMKEYDKATKTLLDGLTNEQDMTAPRAQLFNNLGFVYRDAGQYDLAMQAFQDGLKIKHDNAVLKTHLFLGLGQILIKVTRNAEAIQELTKGLSLCKDPSLASQKKEIVNQLILAHTLEGRATSNEVLSLNALLQS